MQSDVFVGKYTKTEVLKTFGTVQKTIRIFNINLYIL